MDSRDAELRARAPDGGWGWVIVVASFFNMTFCMSTIFSFAVIFVEWKQVFDSSSSVVALLGSVLSVFAFGFSIVAGALINKFGNRPIAISGFLLTVFGLATSAFTRSLAQLFITYGVITGIGLSMAMSPTQVIIQEYFDRKRVLASGLVICGISLGSMVAGPYMRMLIDTYAWNGALLLHAGVILHGVIFSCAFRPLRQTRTQRRPEQLDGKTTHSYFHRIFFGFFDCALWFEPKFALFAIGSFCLTFASFSFPQHQVNFAMLLGVEKQQAALMPTLIGSGSLTSRLLFSVVSNHPKVNRPLQSALTNIVLGLVLIFSFAAYDLVTVGVVCVAFGFCVGGIDVIKAAVLVDLLGVGRIAQSFGMFTMCVGPSILLGSPLTGFLLDTTGSYVVPFAVLGTVAIIGGFLILGVVIILHRGKTGSVQNHHDGLGEADRNAENIA